MTADSKTRNRVLLFLAAFLFSTGGAAIKSCELTSWQVAGFRAGIAAVVLLILIPDARRDWTWRKAAAGLAYAATTVAFVLANKMTTSANAIFLQSTAPLYMLVLGPLVLREPVRRMDIAMMSVVAGGAALLLHGSANAGAGSAAGNLIAIFSGFAWAWTLTGLRWFGKRHPGDQSAAGTAALGNLIAFAVCLPMALPVTRGSATDVAVLLYLGIFQVGLAYAFLTRSIRHVPALEASTLLLVEPVFNPFWSWLIRGERPGNLVMLGGVLIICAAFGGTWWQSRAAGPFG